MDRHGYFLFLLVEEQNGQATLWVPGPNRLEIDIMSLVELGWYIDLEVDVGPGRYNIRWSTYSIGVVPNKKLILCFQRTINSRYWIACR
jgi:hypothetical protein